MQVAVRVEGADQALRALRVLEPTVARKVGREIGKVGADLAAEIRNRAPSQAPVSGWRATPSGWPAWTSVQSTHQRRGANVVVNTRSGSDNRIAGMVEFIGNATKIKSERGAVLSRMFNERLGGTVPLKNRNSPGRLTYRVLNERYSGIVEEIKRACDDAVAEVNRRMP